MENVEKKDKREREVKEEVVTVKIYKWENLSRDPPRGREAHT